MALRVGSTVPASRYRCLSQIRFARQGVLHRRSARRTTPYVFLALAFAFMYYLHRDCEYFEPVGNTSGCTYPRPRTHVPHKTTDLERKSSQQGSDFRTVSKRHPSRHEFPDGDSEELRNKDEIAFPAEHMVFLFDLHSVLNFVPSDPAFNSQYGMVQGTHQEAPVG